jgi:hypothetical protein
MKGRLSEISTVGLIKMFHEGRQSGRLALTASDGGAALYFTNGNLVCLVVDGPRSPDGPYDIFRWRDGEFEFALGTQPPASDFGISAERFIEEGENYERRWQSFANVALSTLTFVRPSEAPPVEAELEPAAKEALAALRRAGEGLPLISLAKRLELGFLGTAELAKRLYDGGFVVFESPVARHLGGAVQDVLTGVLRTYEIFAGKVLARKLVGKVAEFAEHLGLPVKYDGRELAVVSVSEAEEEIGQWRVLFGFIISEMAGPLGGEVARLLWEKTLTSVEPATAGVVSVYGLDVVRPEGVTNRRD